MMTREEALSEARRLFGDAAHVERGTYENSAGGVHGSNPCQVGVLYKGVFHVYGMSGSCWKTALEEAVKEFQKAP